MSSQHVSKLELSANIPLGEGGFGTVLKVRNQETKVEYALKQVDFKPDEWEATMIEANIHSRLSHRNVVGYFGPWTSKNGKLNRIQSPSKHDNHIVSSSVIE